MGEENTIDISKDGDSTVLSLRVDNELIFFVPKSDYETLKAERDQWKTKHEQAMKDWSADAIKKTERIVELEAQLNQLKEHQDILDFTYEVEKKDHELTKADLTRHKELLREKDIEIDILKNPGYCTVCGSCGEEGCCSLQKCKFAPTENEIINSLSEENAGLRQDYKDLKSKLEKYEEIRDEVFQWFNDNDGYYPIHKNEWMHTQLKALNQISGESGENTQTNTP